VNTEVKKADAEVEILACVIDIHSFKLFFVPSDIPSEPWFLEVRIITQSGLNKTIRA